jgi:periplasmic protein TonB
MRHILLPILLLCATPLLAQEPVIQVPDVQPTRAEEAPPVYQIVEEMPEFPGGNEAMMKYIGKHLKYPEKAVENNIQGVVYVRFVVDPEGKIIDPKVLRGIGYGCDEAAWEMVKNMPPWTPGRQRGKAVHVQYNLPIRFKM